ncbi:hypothetical protein CFC21_000463 [Triticum aestivum]|uniref:ABC transmembrane type-1 domain-containing protein n=1 Tax=Triticum aestivum TaxID=4565 RepID=A0A3B5XUA4_WHEAT|nr:hypothetical protein CFC21_000463 [Triticum aestivum]
MNHLVAIGGVAMLLFMLTLQLFVEIPKNKASPRQLIMLTSRLHLAAVLFSGCLGLVYLGLGIWVLGNNFNQEKTITIKACLDVLSLPGAILLLLYGIQHRVVEEGYGRTGNGLHEPLNMAAGSEVADSESRVTTFAKAGFFSEMSFWWLNPLMNKGYEKPLEDNDVPLLGAMDLAQNQYLMFMEKLNSKKRKKITINTTPWIFWTIVSCHKHALLVSGFFALLKVLTLSTGPILLKAFINLSLGKGTFKYEGYVLAAMMFVCKCCESLSHRQWNFRIRRLGLQVRSFLSTAIYKKQQKLSNAETMNHSSGEIMNYVNVDAYRIGEFPYWFHQTWTTSVQLCIALAILYKAVGAATLSSLVVIIITVLSNAPLAKLQHKFQSKLMETQDSRLKAMSESLVHMKDPVRSIPDVIGAVIQAKVAFTRISKFLDAHELNGQIRKKYCVGIDYPISMNLCSFSWDENPSKPTLKNINLVVKVGEKVAICGEVGSGKSTLLAAILGEVPKTKGTIHVFGKIAYVSQNAWIQTRTVQDNILFGSSMDRQRYQDTLAQCSLVKDLEMLPYEDCTQIGERRANLSGGQKQRVQLARALYQNPDIYLLDDPFSVVDAHTATSLFNVRII